MVCNACRNIISLYTACKISFSETYNKWTLVTVPRMSAKYRFHCNYQKQGNYPQRGVDRSEIKKPTNIQQDSK